MRGVVAERARPTSPTAEAAAEWPLASPFSIRDVRIPNRVVQAPLAGIANRPFRVQAHRHGAGMAVSEMVASLGVRHGNRRTMEMLDLDPHEGVTAIQLFGADPGAMADAAVAVQEAGAAMVDINMGCPVPKVCKTGAGSSLLADPDLAARIVAAMRDAVRIPVTVKMRRGLTPADARPAEVARWLAAAGADAITIHPRAAAEEYRGVADHAVTAEVVAAVEIPVIASGDITTPEAARDVFERTGCAAVMIGRAGLGDPWLYGAIATGRPSARPGLAGVVAEIGEFATAARALLGDRRAMHFMRKFYPWYLAGEGVPQSLLTELLVLDDLDVALARLRHLAGDELATSCGLN